MKHTTSVIIQRGLQCSMTVSLLFLFSLSSCSSVFFKRRPPKHERKEVSLNYTDSKRQLSFENKSVYIFVSEDDYNDVFKPGDLQYSFNRIYEVLGDEPIYESDTNCIEFSTEKWLKCYFQTIIIPKMLNKGLVKIVDKIDNSRVSEIAFSEIVSEEEWHSIEYYINAAKNPFFIINISQLE